MCVIRADYSTRCDSAAYMAMLPHATLMLLIYPIGIPLMYLVLVVTYRHKINLKLPDERDDRVKEEMRHLPHLQAKVNEFSKEKVALEKELKERKSKKAVREASTKWARRVSPGKRYSEKEVSSDGFVVEGIKRTWG